MAMAAQKTTVFWAVLAVSALSAGGALLAMHGRQDVPNPAALQRQAREEAALQRLEQLAATEEQRRAHERAAHDEPAPRHAREGQPSLPTEPPPPAPAEARGTNPSPEEPSNEQLLEAQQAQQLLDDATRAGRWDEAEKARFRAHFKTVTGAQQAELVSQLNQAMLQGKLQFEPGALPL